MKNTPALIDIGVNLADSRFNDDLVDVLERAQQAGVDTLVMTGTDEEVSRTVSKLAHQYDKQFPAMLYATVGIHPHYADQFNSNSLTTLSQLATSPKVVAIGETGLDFNRNFSAPKNQIHAFEQQLQLASELNKPVFMHERDAARRQLEILRAHRDYLSKGVIHCFTGDRATLFAYLDLDLYIGITGWICDERRGLPLQQLVASIPLDRLMIESDAPYLLPRTIQPQPSNRRNEPCYLPWVLKGIAKFRDEPIRTLAAATRKTTQAFFNL